jgi:AcrR family transcriptional regulator
MKQQAKIEKTGLMENINQDYLLRGEQTRRELIDAACDLFILNGFHATTTRQITEKLGLVAGALYNHFESKTALFEAVLDTYHPWLRIPEVLRNANGGTVEEYIRDASEKLLKEWDKRPELIRLHLIEVLEFNGQHIPSLFEKTFTKVSKTIEEVRAKDEKLKDVNVPLLYRAVLGLFFGYLMSDKAIVNKENQLKENSFIEGGFDYFADTYLYGLFNQNINQSKNKETK